MKIFYRVRIIMILIPLAAALLIGCSTAPLTMKVYDSKALSTTKSLAILDFSTKGAKLNYEGNADSLGHVLALLLQQKLQQKVKSLEVDLGERGLNSAGLIVDGGFTNIDEGDAAARVMVGQEGVTLALDGVIKNSEGKVIANFNASKTSAGGPLGMGGLLAGDSDAIIDNLMEEAADELSDFIVAQTTQDQQ